VPVTSDIDQPVMVRYVTRPMRFDDVSNQSDRVGAVVTVQTEEMDLRVLGR
jgi:hypothetical protein